MERYKINEQAIISFSGGRSSGYMLKKIIDAYDGALPDHLKIVFANTGKEMPETLDFVRDCGKYWNVGITWLECRSRRGNEDENKYVYETVVVDHATASRNGEPFASLIKARRYLPNPVARFCTQELKILRIKYWANAEFGNKDWVNVVGLRYDEPRRIAKTRDRKDVIVPLADNHVSKAMVGKFWEAQPFDLNLANNNGTTDFGNCDLCFLKGAGKRKSIMEQRPDLADWWIEQEESLSAEVGKGAFFRSDSPSYRQMLVSTKDQESFDFDDMDTIPCFCSD